MKSMNNAPLKEVQNEMGTLTRYISVYAVKTRAQTKVISISDQVSPAHKTQYTTRAEAAAVMVKKRCHDAGRLATPEAQNAPGRELECWRRSRFLPLPVTPKELATTATG